MSTGYWLEYLFGFVPEFSLRLYGVFFTRGLWGFITLGQVPGAKNGDYSMILLINGIIVVIILLIFLLVFICNLVDAYKSAKYIEKTKHYKNLRVFFKEFYDKYFIYVVLTPIVLLIVFVTIMPMFFSILTVFTNYSKGNLPPANLIDRVGFENFKNYLMYPFGLVHSS